MMKWSVSGGKMSTGFLDLTYSGEPYLLVIGVISVSVAWVRDK